MKINKSDPDLESLVRRIRNGEIDLQPDFQRGEVWDNPRQQRLVDTILRDWYVPAVHLVADDSDERELVLDGQQRLATIFKFFNDKLRINGKLDPYDSRIFELDGKRYSELPAGVRRAVDRFSLQVIKLTDHKPQEPNELFFRLNQSYNLTPPEKRNALHGTARDQVKDLVDELTSIGLLNRETIGFSNARLAYDDIVARTAVSFEKGGLRQHINNTVVEDFYRSESFREDTILAMRESGTLLYELIQKSTSRVKLNKGTLQSWLTYCYWAPQHYLAMPPTLLADFEADRMAARNGTHPTSTGHDSAISQVLRLYDDRASYRVTDVSSVLIRDLTIHLYAEIVFGVDSRLNSNELLDQIIQNPDATVGLVNAFLEVSKWGEDLHSGIAS